MTAAALTTGPRVGIDCRTGQALTPDDHLRQSISKILFTPIGSRVMRRDFGSLLPELLDQPLNALTRQRLYAAVAIAVRRWEPRVRLLKVAMAIDAAGHAFLDLSMQRLGAPADERTRLSLPLLAASATPSAFASA